jgi:hypothetical protein
MRDTYEAFDDLIENISAISGSVRVYGRGSAELVNWEKLRENFNRLIDLILEDTYGFDDEGVLDEEGVIDVEEAFVYDDGL